jgi:hypothetical protein
MRTMMIVRDRVVIYQRQRAAKCGQTRPAHSFIAVVRVLHPVRSRRKTASLHFAELLP